MSRAAERSLDDLFRAAQRDRVCAHPSTKREFELLRRRTASGEVVRVARGLYARRSFWEGLSCELRAVFVLRSLQRLHPDWVFCAESAALLYGLPVAHSDVLRPHVAVSRESRPRQMGIAVRHIIDLEEIRLVDGVRVTSLARTAFDCARREPFGRALAVVDAVLRRYRVTAGWLIDRFRLFPGGSPGAWRAFRIAAHADPRSESAGESIARAAMVGLGFAVPDLQVQVADPIDPDNGYRLDFVWRLPQGGFVIGEFDGYVKYEDPAMLRGRSAARALADERHREARLSLLGAPIVRLSIKDVSSPERLARILSSYGIPRDFGTERLERRCERLRSRSSARFAVLALDAA